MTDQANPSSAPASRAQGFWSSRGLLITLILVLAVGLAGAFVNQAVSQDQGFGPWHGGWHHGGGFMDGPLDPAAIEEHADRAARHLAIEVDATAEQQDKLRAIVKAAVKDLLPLRDQLRAGHQQAHDLLTQPTIDRAALDRFRSQKVALLDTASKRITQAIGDAAEVLTPEQRQKIGEFLSQRGGHWHGWRHG
jgi:Spy/CpxP family protein refolding chaperone